MPKQARDLMSSPVVTVRPDDTLALAAKRMLDHGVSALVVVDAEDDVVGVLTHTDFEVRAHTLPFSQHPVPELMRRLTSWQELEQTYADAGAMKVKELMSQPVRTVGPETPVGEVARLMLEHRIKRVPVVEGGRLVGIVTRHDFLKLVAL